MCKTKKINKINFYKFIEVLENEGKKNMDKYFFFGGPVAEKRKKIK